MIRRPAQLYTFTRNSFRLTAHITTTSFAVGSQRLQQQQQQRRLDAQSSRFPQICRAPFYSSTADRHRRRRRRLILCLSESRSIPAAVLPRLDYCNALSRDGRTLCKANSSTAGHLSFHVSFTRLKLTGLREYDAFGSKRRSSGKLTYLVRTLTISDDI